MNPATERVTLYCTRRPSALTTRHLGQVQRIGKGKERKSIYIAPFYILCLSQSAHAWITVLSAKTPCLPLRQKVYPDYNFVLFLLNLGPKLGLRLFVRGLMENNKTKLSSIYLVLFLQSCTHGIHTQ